MDNSSTVWRRNQITSELESADIIEGGNLLRLSVALFPTEHTYSFHMG